MVDDNTPHRQDPPSSSPPPRAAARHPVWRIVFILLGTVLLLALAGTVALGMWAARLAPQTPDLHALLKAGHAKPSILLSAEGTRLATFSDGQRKAVPLEQVSTYVIQALIATEDHRFYEHSGVDIQRTLAAVLHTAGGDEQGGSTITQQLARNLFPRRIGHSRTIERKLREMITALRLEKAYSKDQILEIYLNTVPFLYNVVGIEMAARTYFDKPAADLDALESATLIGMLKGTSYYNPVLNPERAQQRRNVVLAQMVRYGMLSQAEFDALRDKPLHVTLHRQPDPLGIAPHFAGYVRRQMSEWAQRHGYNLETDGLVIESTLDDRLQHAAQQAVERQSRVLQDIADVEWGRKSDRLASYSPTAYGALRKKVEPFSYFWQEHEALLDDFVRETPQYRNAIAAGGKDAAVLARLKADKDFIAQLRAAKTRLEAGFVAMDPTTGAIKAWVGSRDFSTDQFDHVAQAERQPGSTFKPIVYGAALEQGLLPERLYTNGPVDIPLADGGVWRPTDMTAGDGAPITMREGLIYSRNTVTAQVMQDTGVSHVVELARAVGINQSRLNPVPSLALGTSPVTLLEMVNAYSTIADLGEYHAPLCVTRIRDRHGKILAEFDGGVSHRAMSHTTAVELLDMLHGVVQQGTGTVINTRFHLAADIAGKTGTTQNNTDGWFILMQPRLVAGAWVGFNDQRISMRSDYWGQGGHNAVLLVGDFFRDVLKEKLINASARFPHLPHPPPLMVQSVPEVPRIESIDAMPPGYGVITSDDQNRSLIITPGEVQSAQRSEDALGSFLGRLERRRRGGAQYETGASGNAGTSRAGTDGGD